MKFGSIALLAGLGVGAFILFKNLNQSNNETYTPIFPSSQVTTSQSNQDTGNIGVSTPTKIENIKQNSSGGVSTQYNVTNKQVAVSESQNKSTSGIGINNLKPQSGGVPSGWAASSNSPRSQATAYYAAPQLKGTAAAKAAYGIK